MIDTRHDSTRRLYQAEHHCQIDAAARHRNVRDVHRPDLVRTRDLEPAQQVRVDLVAGFWLARARTAIERFYPHLLHQRFHMTAADLAPFGSQQALQHARTRKWKLQMQFVNPPHQSKVSRRHRPRQVVHAATADVEDFRLLADRQIVCAVDHRSLRSAIPPW